MNIKRVKKKIRTYFYTICSHVFNKEDIVLYVSYSKDVFSNIETLHTAFLKNGIDVKIIYNRSGFLLQIYNLLALAKARTIVTDVSSLYAEFSIHKQTKIVQCWHAGGVYKCIAYDTTRRSVQSEQEEKKIMKKLNQISYYITSAEGIEDIFMNAFQLKADQIKPLGLPRTDLLYANSLKRLNTKETIKQKELETNKKIRVLYAPTFRNENQNRTVPCLLDFDLLQKEVGNHFELAFRSHPTSSYNKQEGYLDYSDKSYLEIMQSTDILITDYSSIFFDFLYYNKPVIIYIPDYEEYTTKHRELYIHPETLFTDSVCSTIKELIEKLKEYSNKTVDYSHLWEKYMGACDGNASQKIVNFVKEL